ncbi:P-loop containing nucleoside triphosphate hydrolase protein [Exidia glandulosa HHB12029]|uniref:RNA helicase n=1 Tax=Exidia glandulosa HHB12029 TaxID=1314781 RepID=A0A165GPC8_EXIGL|nr:P-loop containing nucleoside triphosphate hydrolase protein [Exidia glandulosa HHB12029]
MYEYQIGKTGVAWPALDTIAGLRNAADMRHPAELYPEARRLHRKIIMHVGPTNSGKTYNALRALAAAKRGVYAGPLRLLAHEVYTRLNKGTILPADIDRDPNDPDKLHPRVCNMITGEEKRILAIDAPLASCTVEMLQTVVHYDVAVVDEIQMISDPNRGGAWTAAVLGLMADELHLCGEASAVPIIQSLCEATGDELVVNDYERLSPLQPADEALGNDFSVLREGDCVVAFSRNRIFALKRRIEEETKFRCAVAYGMLPPELRAKQAALFNEPGNEYGVMVASDAIGMGLNLKIKRVIFETTKKWDGTKEITLTLSSIKQIAGRAGRFSLGQDPSAMGTVTAILPHDLDVIKLALQIPTRPLKRAVIAPSPDQLRALLQLLGPKAQPSVVFEMLPYLARVPNMFTLTDMRAAMEASALLESGEDDRLSLDEYWIVLYVPFNSRDFVVAEAFRLLTSSYKDDGVAPLEATLLAIGVFEDYQRVSKMRKKYERPDRKEDPAVFAHILPRLESMHRVLIAYLWLSYRLPTAFHEQPRAFELKEDLELCISFYLRELGTQQHAGKKQARVAEPVDADAVFEEEEDEFADEAYEDEIEADEFVESSPPTARL